MSKDVTHSVTPSKARDPEGSSAGGREEHGGPREGGRSITVVSRHNPSSNDAPWLAGHLPTWGCPLGHMPLID